MPSPLPQVVLIAAQSIDGYIARTHRPGTDFCSPADQNALAAELKAFDSLVMGRATFDTLRERILESKTDRYLRKIVTRQPAKFAPLTQPGKVEFTADAPEQILAELAARDRKRVALLGGSQIYSAFVEAQCVDEIWLTLEAISLGEGVPLFAALKTEIRYDLISTEARGPQATLLKLKPIYD